MWPPPHRYPMMGPPVLMPPSAAPLRFPPFPHINHPRHAFVEPPRPIAARPPWEHGMGESWKSAAAALKESWRQHSNSWSNRDIYRQQYSQLPLSRPYGKIARRPESNNLNENMIPPEYAVQIDYEKKLKEQYERPQNNYNDFSNTAAGTSQEFQIKTEPSARKIKVNWKLPRIIDDKCKIRLVVKLEQLEGGIGRGARQGELGLILDKLLPIHLTRGEFDAVPGSLYTIELSLIGKKNEIMAVTMKTERAIFSMEELKVLMQKALQFTGTQMQPFTYVYRCKPKIYWDYIYNETGQIMQVYPKDSNGQAASPINQNIHGLFFSARTNPDGSLPNSSPFGDIRMVIPAMTLLDPQRVNLYFSDFYCNRVTHYVTIVVAIKDSPVDKFCREKLLPLSAFENPFLLFQLSNNPMAPVKYSVNKKIWVEIYYTEDIPMRWGRFDNIIPQGAGTSKIGGLPHNKTCRTCNIYPVGAHAPQPPANFEPIPEKKAEEMVKEANKAELVDLVDSDESGGEDLDENSQHVPYGDLKERLEQLNQAIQKDYGNTSSNNGNNSNPVYSYGKFLNDLTVKIRTFMDGMKSDFTMLDAKISHLEAANVFSPHESQSHQNSRAISYVVDALLDNMTNSGHGHAKRSRKLSAGSLKTKKSRNESL